MKRREFLASAAVAAGLAPMAIADDAPKARTGEKFALKYAPHFGMFRHHAGDDPIDQLKFMGDEGFTAFEDNGMKGRSIDEQKRIAAEMARLNMTMGVFVVNMDTAWGATLATGNADSRDKFLDECKASVDVAKRVNATWMTVVPGTVEPRLGIDYQNANVIDALRRASDIFEPHGLVMVLEALNPRDHPNMFLTTISQGYMICEAVNSPACKILDDLYHQQVTEGNLIPNFERAWKHIAYFQLGDNPGRNEPTTGEVNYQNIFRRLKSRHFAGVVGMEHGNSKPDKAGERAVIDAYRWCDQA